VESNRIISSLCYFSIFFAGFIFPAVVYFIVNNPDVKHHAKRAFLSHMLPFLTLLPFIFIPFTGMEGAALLSFLTFGLFGLVSLIVVIWNVIKGILILRD
jgi:uncharacterized membrane protein